MEEHRQDYPDILERQTVAPDDWIEVDIGGTPYFIPVYAAA